MMSRSRTMQQGFSFIELVVAIFILGLLMGIGIPTYLYFVNLARTNTTHANLRLLKNTLDLYHIQHGKYPAKLEELAGDPTKGIKGMIDKVPQDGWKNDFYYKVLPAGSKQPYELYSYGPNGPAEGTPEERISVWNL